MRQASALRAATPLFVFLTVLSSACGAQEKAAAGAGAGRGWVPLPSGGRLYYEVAGTKGDTIVVPGAVFWESALAPPSLTSLRRTAYLYVVSLQSKER